MRKRSCISSAPSASEVESSSCRCLRWRSSNVLIANLPIAGAFIIPPEFLRDERGFFARLFDRDELAKRGALTQFVQHSVSFNEGRGTLRGLHYQASPHAEAKLVRCTAGAVHDVVVDLRADSPTLGQAASVLLSFENRVTLY